MLTQGVGSAQHRFEVRMKADNRRIYAGYSAMAKAERYARRYTGETLSFSDEDKEPERDRGRDMGKPTVLFRVLPDGSRVAWREFSLKDGRVVSKDTPAYKQEQEEQKVRSAAAVETARKKAASEYQAEADKSIEQYEKMGDAMGKQLRGLFEEVASLREQVADAQPEAAATTADKSKK